MKRTDRQTPREFQTETLTGQACGKLRPLWEEVFSEESQEFTDYYFVEKAPRNHALALNSGTGYVAMVHLSPYEMELRTGKTFTCVNASYLVGVATRREYRHRGCMDRLLKASLRYLYEEEQPFAFLMPANPEIYSPYQFTWIYEKEEYELCGLPLLSTKETGAELRAASTADQAAIVKSTAIAKAVATANRTATGNRTAWKEITGLPIPSGKNAFEKRSPFWQNAFELQERDLPALVNYVNQRLKGPEGKDVFIKRDSDYFRIMQKELRVQNGGCMLLRNREAGAPFPQDEKSYVNFSDCYVNSIDGYFLYTDEQHLEIQEALWDGESAPVRKKGICTPAIMARIVHLEAMLSLLRTKEGEVCFTMEVRDPLIQGNNGVWACQITPSEAAVRLLEPKAKETADAGEWVKGDCLVTIEKLTGWIFGCLPAEECFCFDGKQGDDTERLRNKMLCKLKRIAIFGRVFINEIV